MDKNRRKKINKYEKEDTDNDVPWN